MPIKVTSEERLRPCGHRLSESEFKIIRKYARKFGGTEGATLRLIVREFDKMHKEFYQLT